MSLNINFDLSSDAGKADLNAFLSGRSYLVGFNPTKADLAAAAIIGAGTDKATYPNTWRYVSHITSFKAGQTKKWPAGITGVSDSAAAAAPAAPAAGAGKPAKKAAPADDSDSDSDAGDLFGSDSDDDGAVDAAAAPAPAPAAAKKPKKKKIEKTQLTFYCNPSDSEVAISDMEAAIRAIEIEGLRWGDAFGTEDIAFGLQRLHVQCCIVNDLVGVDQVTDACQELEQVGSTAPGTMNRLG